MHLSTAALMAFEVMVAPEIASTAVHCESQMRGMMSLAASRMWPVSTHWSIRMPLMSFSSTVTVTGTSRTTEKPGADAL